VSCLHYQSHLHPELTPIFQLRCSQLYLSLVYLQPVSPYLCFLPPSSWQPNPPPYRATAFSPVLAGAQSVPVKRSKSVSMNRSGSKRDRSIPRRPLLWLAAALLFTLPPMFGSLVRWVPCVFLLALAMKFWMEPRGYRLRFATLKLMLAAMGLFAIFASYGSLKGIEPGISLLVVLVSL